MNIFDQLLADNQIPKFVRVRHEMDHSHIDDIEGAVAQAMRREGTLDRIKPGDSVCITAGSRDVANIARIIRAICDQVKSVGAHPFIIPAMGSHAGAKAEGQRGIIEAIPAGRILEEEPPLLEYAKSRMAKVPFDQADILFVDETGKDISGAGMDPNVTGRSPVLGISRPFFQRIAVFDLTDKSHGNFGGLGSADVTTQRLYRKIDFEQTYPNGITAAEPLAVRLPAVMPSDRTAMQFALRTATDCDWEKGPRIVWLKNTLSLSEFYISEALIPDAEALDNVTVVSEPMEVIFDEEGNVKELR